MDELIIEGIIIGTIALAFVISIILAIYSQRDND